VSNIDKLVGSGTGNYAITAGANFDAAFESTISVTTATLADTKTFTYTGASTTKDTTITIDGTSLVGNGATEDITVTTGSGDDTVTFTGDATWTSGTAGATITVNTGAGDDTISVTVGTIADSANNQAIVIDAGTGKDTVTLDKVNGATTAKASYAKITVEAGDSLTTAYDTYKGVDDGAAGGAGDVSDLIDFSGTGAVTDFTASADAGTIMSHTLSNGVATFDDAATFGAAIKINSTNLSDVVSYLATNTATNDVAAFLFDKDNDGDNDGTMVFHNGTTDSLVFLDGLTVTALSASSSATDGTLFIA